MRWLLLLIPLIATKIVKSDAEWEQTLGKERYRVMREKGTERAFSGKYLFALETGTYLCAACEQPLLRSKDKYDAHSGWPCFTQTIDSECVYYLPDPVPYVKRYEVLCRSCDSHLGHVFHDGPPPKY